MVKKGGGKSNARPRKKKFHEEMSAKCIQKGHITQSGNVIVGFGNTSKDIDNLSHDSLGGL